jgi:hypothetical protein
MTKRQMIRLSILLISFFLFHSSDGKAYENNPAINAVGINVGVQF